MTLTSDLVFKIIVSGAFHHIIWAREPIDVWLHLGMVECHVINVVRCVLLSLSQVNHHQGKLG